MSKTISYDVIIIGAGMVGTCLAIALDQMVKNNKEIKIVILETNNLHEREHIQSPSFEDKSLALTWQSINILKELGIAKEIVSDRTSD